MDVTLIRSLPPVEELRERFDYNPITGDLTYRVSIPQNAKGDMAGYVTHGRRRVSFKGKQYEASRLAWAIYHGSDPGRSLVDHIDHDTLNNRIENLRLATPQQNIFNSRGHGKRGLPKGVSPVNNGFMARICFNRHLRYLGIFPTPEEAGAAYLKAAKEIAGQFASTEVL